MGSTGTSQARAEVIGECGGEPVYRLSSGREYASGVAVGGLWEELGRLQLDFLLEQGLRPEHRFLDVGCGSLRGGVHFIPYLEDGNYHGIDAQDWLLLAAEEVELPRHGLEGRRVHLECRDDFDFRVFGKRFEFALAQSVFTHLPWNSIQRCLSNVRDALTDRGRFYTTFFEDPDGTHRTTPITHQPGGITTHPDRDPYHYEFAVFEELADRIGLEVDYIGDWDHPRNQKMMAFRRRPRRGARIVRGAWRGVRPFIPRRARPWLVTRVRSAYSRLPRRG